MTIYLNKANKYTVLESFLETHLILARDDQSPMCDYNNDNDRIEVILSLHTKHNVNLFVCI